MIRFSTFSAVGNISGGVPYVNTDFSDVLQIQHIKAYGSILDGMNQGSTLSTTPNNNGIILSGCKIAQSTPTSYTMNFANSIVYIDGEFYENDPNLGNGVSISSADFYIIPGPTTSVTRPLRDWSTLATFSQTRYFTWQSSLPNGPHIKFSQRGTSRYYSRILKYFTSTTGDIYCASNKDLFNNGVGFNDMEGFVIMDDQMNIPGLPDLRGRFLRGRSSLSSNQFFGGATSHSLTQFQTEGHFHSIDKPYWAPNWNTPFPDVYPMNANHIHFYNTSTVDFNVTTENSVSNQQIQSNNLWSVSGNPDLQPNPQDLRYPPPPTVISQGSYPDAIPTNTLPRPGAFNTRYAMNDSGSMFAYRASEPIDYWNNIKKAISVDKRVAVSAFIIDNITTVVTPNTIYTGGINDINNSELQTHRHPVSADLGDKILGNVGTPHENRPPYIVMVYYTKKPKT